jgi:acetate kinase
MNGADIVVFSGAIGYRSAFIRNQIKKHFKYLPKLKFLTMETNEELMMARECKKI